MEALITIGKWVGIVIVAFFAAGFIKGTVRALRRRSQTDDSPT